MIECPPVFRLHSLDLWWEEYLCETDREEIIAYLTEFSPESLQSGYGETTIYMPKGGEDYTVETEIKGIASGMARFSDNFECVVKLFTLRLALLAESENLFRLHLGIIEFAHFLYKRRSEPGVLDEATRFYALAVSVSDEVYAELSKEPWFDGNCINEAAKRLSIIFEKSELFNVALQVIEKVCAEGWPGDWSNRTRRIQRKLEKQGVSSANTDYAVEEALATALFQPRDVIEVYESLKDGFEDVLNRVSASRPWVIESSDPPEPIPSPKSGPVKLQRLEVRVAVDTPNKLFEVTKGATTRQAQFPPVTRDFIGVEWWEFINIIAAASDRQGGIREGVEQWWVLETDPLEMQNVSPSKTPRFELTLLSNDPYGLTKKSDPFASLHPYIKPNWNTGEALLRKNEYANRPRPAYLYFESDHHGRRVATGFVGGKDRNIWDNEIGLGGIMRDSNFDLYSELADAVNTGLERGFTPTGPWVGRFITGAEPGTFECGFYARAEFSKPGFSTPMWLD